MNNPEFLGDLQSYLGKPVTGDRLNILVRSIVEEFRAHHRRLVDVVVPEQDVTNCVIQIAVIEFRVGNISTEGNEWFSNALLTSRLRLQPGDHVDTVALLNDVEALNDNPFRHVDVIYDRRAEPGQTNIILETKDRLPISAYLGYDDSGTKSLGISRFIGGFSWGNVFGLDHRFAYQVTTSDDLLFGDTPTIGRPDQPRLIAHTASYTIPMFARDNLTIFGVYSTAAPLIPYFQQTGTSYQGSLRYTHVLPEIDDYTHELSLGFDYKRSNNSLEFGGLRIANGYTDIDQFVVGYSAGLRDAMGSTRLSATFYLSPGGLSRNNNQASYQDSFSRAGASPSYIYGQIGLDRDTQITKELVLATHAVVQAAGAKLLPSEQLGLGGAGSVRGYDQYSVEGDQGWLISNEFRYTLGSGLPHLDIDDLESLDDSLQLVAFVDAGHVSSQYPQNGEPTSLTTAGTGLGVRYRLERNLNLSIDYAWQLVRLPSEPTLGSRAHVSLIGGF